MNLGFLFKKNLWVFLVWKRENTLKDDFGVLSNCVDASIRCRIFLVYYLSCHLKDWLFSKGKLSIMLQIVLVLEIKASDRAYLHISS